MSKNLSVKRSELKYFVNNNDYLILAKRLQYILKADKYSTPLTGYRVRSLYFDSYDDECLYDKQAGILVRKKYRLRIYDTKTQKAKFEIKHKQNNQIFKETAEISRQSAIKVINGEYEELLSYNNPVLTSIYTTFVTRHYQPRVIIEYFRDAFMYDHFNIRITFDKDLRCCSGNFDLFSDKLPLIPVLESRNQILEIKFDQILPDYIRTMLQIGSFERTAISKYTLSRRFEKINSWEDN